MFGDLAVEGSRAAFWGKLVLEESSKDLEIRYWKISKSRDVVNGGCTRLVGS
jgi:hypothetical protein